MPISRRIPPDELAEYSSEIAGLNEARRWALYDTVSFAAAASVSGTVKFFSTPLGQGTTPKTLLQTNLRQAGQLPARQAMEVWDIRVQCHLGGIFGSITTLTILNNFYKAIDQLLYGAFVEVKQAQKTDLEISPLAILSAGYGVTGIQWGGSNITAGADAGGGAVLFNNGHPSRAALWNMAPLPIIILPQRTFEFNVTWPTAVALPAGVTLDVIVHLDGLLHRGA